MANEFVEFINNNKKKEKGGFIHIFNWHQTWIFALPFRNSPLSSKWNLSDASRRDSSGNWEIAKSEMVSAIY